MPRALTPPSSTSPTSITKLTNCRLVKNGKLIDGDIWISSLTGKILRSQEAFYSQLAVPDRVINLGGKIVSPGLIDVQLNGAFGLNFSTVPEDFESIKGKDGYLKSLRSVNRKLVRTGVTSYLPTLTSQKGKVYQTVRTL
jgi:N-acetylglucosamine-6-phosphate deacetylase